MIQYRRELPSLMKRLGLPMIAAEIGVAEGNSSVDFLNSGLELLYSIDAWITLPQTGDGGFSQEDFHDKNYHTASYRLAAFKEKSIIIRGISYEVADQIPDNTLGLVYLDGDHSLNGVRKDLDAFYPKLISGGILATHDFISAAYGVREAFEEFSIKNNLELFMIPEDKDCDAGAFLIKK